MIERINAILLAFIDAHDGHSQSDEIVEERLYTARKALFNVPAPSGNRYINDWDILLKIARDYIDARKNTKLTEDYELCWDTEPADVPSLRSLILKHAQKGMDCNQRNSFEKRLRRNFDKNKVELLRQAYFGAGSLIDPGETIAWNLADCLRPFEIRVGTPRSIKLGHKPRPNK